MSPLIEGDITVSRSAVRWSIALTFAVERVAGSLDWRSSRDFFEGGDEVVGLGEAFFDGRGFERGLMTGLAFPDFRDPEDVWIGCVFGNDEAETAGDGVGVGASHLGDEFVAAAGGGGQFDDESVHGGSSKVL